MLLMMMMTIMMATAMQTPTTTTMINSFSELEDKHQMSKRPNSPCTDSVFANKINKEKWMNEKNEKMV